MDKLSFSELVDIEQVRRLMTAYYQVTKMPLGIMDGIQASPVVAGWPDFCAKYHHAYPIAGDCCRSCESGANAGTAEAPLLPGKCPKGLWTAALPIRIETETLATLLVGPFLYEDDPVDLEAYRSQAGPNGFNAEDYLKALRNVPVFSRPQAQAILDYGAALAGLLAQMGLNQLRLRHEMEERKETEQQLLESQRMMELVLDAIPVRVFWKNLNLTYLGCNRRFALDAGLNSPQQIIGKNDFELAWTDQAERYRADDQLVIESGVSRFNYEEPETTPEGKTLWLRTSKIPLWNMQGNIIGVLGIYEDITELKREHDERRKLETQVQNAQKLESLGVLAGGIAHDFNNLLMAILGNTDLALADLSPVSPVRPYMHEVEKASRRAADLCRQMLAYSGKGRFVIQALDLGEVIQEMAHMLEVSISKKAILKYNFAANLPAVEADVSQIRQVIMNLVINASEAIGDKSGVISISTGAMECDRAYLTTTWLNENLAEGLYVYIEVADTGCGIHKDLQPKIFDPFYSTKFIGRGLGLAAVLGIVRGHKGAIKVYSEEGRGSTFKALFPAASYAADQAPDEKTESSPLQRKGAILLVDDEESVRVIGKQMLIRLGFKVLTAMDGREAVNIFQERSGSAVAPEERIICVILDLTMPHMDGEEAFRELRRIQPDVRVLLSSGYNEQEVTQRFVGKGLAGFIQKPYRMAMLAEKMKQVMKPKGSE